MALGYLTLVLHAHLPFVRHPEHDDFLEEDWLYEAITETYLPLLEVFEELRRDKVHYRVTMSFSPTLCAMLADPLLQSRYLRYLDNLIALTTRELDRTRWQAEFYLVVEMYINRLTRCRNQWTTLGGNILTGFRTLAQQGYLELMTCAGTHAFLPLMNQPEAIRAQLRLGVTEFEKHFGWKPRGIWLPECGYFPGLDDLLARENLGYFFTDTHGVMLSEPRPRYGVFAPLRCSHSGIVVCGRDTESSRQVWSAIEGYPGDYAYRDFYRDIGFDLDEEYLKPHTHRTGHRHFTGLKYYRITGRTDDKKPYCPAAARKRASEHAVEFRFNREKQCEWLSGGMNDLPALIVAPYDAELFGHWWFEGPDWLGFLLRGLAGSPTLETITIPEYLRRHPRLQMAQPAFSSWGQGGYSSVWLEASNDWIYPHLHEITDRTIEHATAFADPTPIQTRLLNQMGRELLLAQASDWAFMMKAGTAADYATQRTVTHIHRFFDLEKMLTTGEVELDVLTEIERRDNLFADLDYRIWRRESVPTYALPMPVKEIRIPKEVPEASL